MKQFVLLVLCFVLSLAVVSGCNPLNQASLFLDCPVIRVYSHENHDLIFETGLENKNIVYTDAVISGDYVFVPVYEAGNVLYKDAYIVKYK